MPSEAERIQNWKTAVVKIVSKNVGKNERKSEEQEPLLKEFEE